MCSEVFPLSPLFIILAGCFILKAEVGLFGVLVHLFSFLFCWSVIEASTNPLIQPCLDEIYLSHKPRAHFAISHFTPLFNWDPS